MEPKEDEWHCLNCQVQQSLAEQAAKKLNKKKRLEDEKKRGKHSIKEGKHKESKHSTGRHSIEESKPVKGKPVKNDKQNGHHDSKKRTKDIQKDEDRKLQKNLNKKKNGKSFVDEPEEPEEEEEEYYCPSCSKKDDGSPMVCCDDCDLW